MHTGNLPNSIAVGDFNGDENVDIAVTTLNSGSVEIFLRYGNGTFTEEIFYPIGDYSFTTSNDLDDLNNDGILNIVIAVRNQSYVGVSMG